jgi:hypothetical protein
VKREKLVRWSRPRGQPAQVETLDARIRGLRVDVEFRSVIAERDYFFIGREGKGAQRQAGGP